LLLMHKFMVTPKSKIVAISCFYVASGYCYPDASNQAKHL